MSESTHKKPWDLHILFAEMDKEMEDPPDTSWVRTEPIKGHRKGRHRKD